LQQQVNVVNVTPAARIASAIDVLDTILAGAAAEKTLTTWARKSRFAGSGDRAAIRDLVFDALRCRRSHGWLGGADSGRGLMIGALRAAGQDPDTVFSGEGYGPTPLSDAERQSHDLAGAPLAVQLDVPDWLMDPLSAGLGDDTAAILRLMRQRAPVFLRVNLRKATCDQAAAALHAEGIETQSHSLSPTALCVTSNPRRIQTCQAFRDGLVELQDAGSQAAVDALDLTPGMRVLDYCAGGGGKALAMAARADVSVFAHDIDPLRMGDIPARVERAGVTVPCLDQAGVTKTAPFDFVLCDAPCSGSGAWRRSPEAKWRLTRERLAALRELQDQVLDQAKPLVAANGTLAYVTCSLLSVENQDRIDGFLERHPGWQQCHSFRLTPLDGGDGFYLGILKRLTDRP